MPNRVEGCAATPLSIKPANSLPQQRLEHSLDIQAMVPNNSQRMSQPRNLESFKLYDCAHYTLIVRPVRYDRRSRGSQARSKTSTNRRVRIDEYESTAENEGLVSVVHVWSPPNATILIYCCCLDIKPVFPRTVVRQPARPNSAQTIIPMVERYIQLLSTVTIERDRQGQETNKQQEKSTWYCCRASRVTKKLSKHYCRV